MIYTDIFTKKKAQKEYKKLEMLTDIKQSTVRINFSLIFAYKYNNIAGLYN